jgi:multicomponent K+:H+ antiporter subunit D
MIFWRPASSAADTAAVRPTPVASAGPAWLLALCLLLLTVGARPVQSFMDATAEQLLEPAGYVEAVIRPDFSSPPDPAGPGMAPLRAQGRDGGALAPAGGGGT